MSAPLKFAPLKFAPLKFAFFKFAFFKFALNRSIDERSAPSQDEYVGGLHFSIREQLVNIVDAIKQTEIQAKYPFVLTPLFSHIGAHL
jgi:hypothetical protein